MAKGFSIQVEPNIKISRDVAELCLKAVQLFVNNSFYLVTETKEPDGTITYTLMEGVKEL